MPALRCNPVLRLGATSSFSDCPPADTPSLFKCVHILALLPVANISSCALRGRQLLLILFIVLPLAGQVPPPRLGLLTGVCLWVMRPHPSSSLALELRLIQGKLFGRIYQRPARNTTITNPSPMEGTFMMRILLLSRCWTCGPWASMKRVLSLPRCLAGFRPAELEITRLRGLGVSMGMDVRILPLQFLR